MKQHRPGRTYESVVAGLPAEPREARGIAADTPLLVAALAGDLAAVKSLCAGEVDKKIMSKALVLAADGGHVPVMEHLHRQGANVRWSDDLAFRVAVESGRMDAVRYLCEAKVNVAFWSVEIMESAALCGNIPLVEYLHGQGAEPEMIPRSALMDLARDGKLEMLEYFCCDWEPVDKMFTELLHKAIFGGQVAVVQYMHEKGGEINTDARHSVQTAARNGHLAVLKFLHENGGNVGKDLLGEAAQSGSVPTVRYICDINSDIEDYELSSALLVALLCGHVPVAEYLRSRGGTVSPPSPDILKTMVDQQHMGSLEYMQQQGIMLPPEMRAPMERWQAWNARHGRCPKLLRDLSPFLFRGLAFDAVQAVMEKEGYGYNTAYAYHTAALFGTEERVLDYLERWGKAGKQPLHDIVHMITVPQHGRFNSAAWGDAVLKHGPKMALLVQYADKLPEPVKDSKGQWSYTKTRALVAPYAYARGVQAPELAALCLTHLWSEAHFEDALRLVEKFRSAYGAAQGKPGGRIPDVTIDGVVFGKKGYRFSRLPDGDVRGLLLGVFTDCCQHIAGEGKECAQHGFLSPQGGFYVVEDVKSGEIIAQSWAWRGREEELTLDSLEALPGHMSAGNWKTLCKEFARQAEADTTAHISAVHVGRGGRTPELNYRESEGAEPLDYRGYRDSYSQYWIAPV